MWNKFVAHFLEKHLLLINRQALHLLAEFRNRVKIVSKDNSLMREGKTLNKTTFRSQWCTWKKSKCKKGDFHTKLTVNDINIL